MKTIKIKGITFIHGDCMEFLKEQEENAFDLAIVDPPYGKRPTRKNKMGVCLNKFTKNDDTWDKETPTFLYFKELKTVSKNRIIWGLNYFIEYLENTNCFIYWHKDKIGNIFADGEIAWASFNSTSRYFKFRWHGMLQGDMKNKETTIHPTQKPVQLYKWLLLNYAKPGQTILDTHGGSGSIAIACHQLGFPLTIIEKDAEYFEAMIKRFKLETAQQALF